MRAVEAEERKKAKPKPAEGEEAQQKKAETKDYLDQLLDENTESPPATGNRSSSPVAKIDVQQYVEKEAYLRLAADYENFRKRSVRDRQEAERSGKEKILRGLLEILDNLERGVSQAKDDASPLAQGMRMVLSQAETWLKSEGIEKIEGVGKPFDPAVHEAISQREDSGVENGMVLEQIKRGYRWVDRLLRPATVIVCKNSGTPPPSRTVSTLSFEGEDNDSDENDEEKENGEIE